MRYAYPTRDCIPSHNLIMHRKRYLFLYWLCIALNLIAAIHSMPILENLIQSFRIRKDSAAEVITAILLRFHHFGSFSNFLLAWIGRIASSTNLCKCKSVLPKLCFCILFTTFSPHLSIVILYCTPYCSQFSR